MRSLRIRGKKQRARYICKELKKTRRARAHTHTHTHTREVRRRKHHWVKNHKITSHFKMLLLSINSLLCEQIAFREMANQFRINKDLSVFIISRN